MEISLVYKILKEFGLTASYKVPHHLRLQTYSNGMAMLAEDIEDKGGRGLSAALQPAPVPNESVSLRRVPAHLGAMM